MRSNAIIWYAEPAPNFKTSLQNGGHPRFPTLIKNMTIERRVFWGTPLADSSSLENKLQEALLLDVVGKKTYVYIYLYINKYNSHGVNLGSTSVSPNMILDSSGQRKPAYYISQIWNRPKPKHTVRSLRSLMGHMCHGRARWSQLVSLWANLTHKNGVFSTRNGDANIACCFADDF